MPNLDNTYGTYNKQTFEIKLSNTENNTVVTQSFGGNVDTAKNYFLTTDAINNINDCGTQVSWAITSDGNGIKYTIAFGIKRDADATQWAEIFKSTQTALQDANNFVKSSLLTTKTYNGQTYPEFKWAQTSTDSHLF